MNVMQVEVVSNDGNIFSGEATFVVVPTVNGELGIYPRHEPIMSLVRPGSLRITLADSSETLVAIAGGVLEVHPNKITVLVETAVRSHELDQERAEEAKKAAQAKIVNKDSLDAKSLEKAQAALAVAIAELKALEDLKKRGIK